MKKLAVLAIGLMTFGIVASANAGGQATLSLSPTDINVSTGDTFSVSVIVTPNSESLDTVRADVSYPADKLEVVSFDLGSLFPYPAPGNTIDNTNGVMSQGAFKFGTRVTSSGTLGTITFRSLSDGEAVIRVQSTSKLINNGVEKINTSSLGTASINGSGETVAAAPVEEVVVTDANAEQLALRYFGAFAGRLPSSGEDWSALHCIAYDDCNPGVQDIVREQAALDVYTAKYGAIPQSAMDWQAMHAIAYTDAFIDWAALGVAEIVAEEVVEEVVVVVEEVVEEVVAVEEVATATPAEQALRYFGAFAGRLPSSSADWAAHQCIVDDSCNPGTQNVEKETTALEVYGAKYGSLPQTSMDWNAMHALAYTDVFIDWSEETAAVEEVVAQEMVVMEEVESVEEMAVVDSSMDAQNEAIGFFGQLTGSLPSSDADWTAVDYIVNGYSPAQQDLDLESQALAKFTATFGRLPGSDQDWNIVSAIAYSGAIL